MVVVTAEGGVTPAGWQRWGEYDEAGALNLLGADAVRRGLAAARDGTPVPLAAPIIAGQGLGLPGRPPAAHYMMRDGGDYAAGVPERAGFGYADDVVTLATHGVTHIDALAHIWRDGRMYNGFPASEVTSRGARRLGIDKVLPVVTRGILVDAAANGADRDPRDRVGADELARLVAATGIDPEPGDALLVRTGWMPARQAGRADTSAWPGLDRTCAAFVAESGFVLVGGDNPAVEAYPSGDPDCVVPLHVDLLRGHGVYLVELLDLEALATALEAVGRSDFLFVLAVLPVVGAVGSPVAPVAVL
jgi:kynurenine formamidase